MKAGERLKQMADARKDRYLSQKYASVVADVLKENCRLSELAAYNARIACDVPKQKRPELMGTIQGRCYYR